MRTRTIVSLSSAVGLVLAALVALLAATQQSPSARTIAAVVDAPPQPGGFRWAFPEGTRLVYRLDWRTEQRVGALGPGDAHGELALAGTLELRGHGRRGDAWLVEARLTADEQRFVVLGQDAGPGGALGDGVAWAELADDGTLRAVEVAQDAPATWQNLATALLGQLEVIVPVEGRGETWARAQRGPFGRGLVRYTQPAADTLLRVREAYETVDGLPPGARGVRPEGQGRVRLGPGYLRGLDEGERVVITGEGPSFDGSARLRLALVEVGRFAGGARASGPRRRLRPDERVTDVDAERQALIARVAGLTGEELLAGVLVLGPGGIPDEDRWMWRATGLLQLEPRLCATLGQLFADGKLGREQRGLVLDLLAGAGHAQAQAAMVVALSSPSARERPADWNRYVQRLSFVETPTAETLAFAQGLRTDALAAGDVHTSRASAYVLGNLAGAMAAHGDTAGARALAEGLRRDLVAADAPAERAALITAYAAAKPADVVTVVSAYAADGDVDVRRAVAYAVAEVPGAAAQAVLDGLVTDGDSIVQETTLSVLGGRAPAASTMDVVAGLVASGRLAPVNDLAVAQFAAAQRVRGADLAPLAPALGVIARRSGDPQVKALIARALGR
jgi:hypothetical protein